MVKITGAVNERLKASTILEVVVSMVVIVLVMGIAFMIFANVQRLSTPVKNVSAHNILQDELLKVSRKTITDSTWSTGNWKLERTIIPDQPEKGLKVITLKAYDENEKLIDSIKQVQSYD